MAHIPFGYRIEKGKAVIDEGAAREVRNFFSGYLSGLSITNAYEQVDIPMTYATARHMLENTTYLGDDYYPQLIDEETFQAVAKKRAERCSQLGRDHKPDSSKKPVPVKTRFRMRQGCESKHPLTPADRAAFIYDCIRPCVGGENMISDEDKSKVRKWLVADQ